MRKLLLTAAALLACAATPAMASAATSLTVPATSSPADRDGTGPTDTGIALSAGQQVTVSASGLWNVCPTWASTYCQDGPDGAPGSTSPAAPASTAPNFSLIGSTDGGNTWFAVGSGPTTVTGPGELLLAMNDWAFGDNYGYLNVTVTPVDPDTDADGVNDSQDNCKTVANADQADVDGDGIGDKCDAAWFAFNGFSAPVNGGGVLNLAKAGSAIPVKFSLGGDKGLSVFEPGYPKAVKRSSCDATGTDAVEETTVATRSGLTYDAAAGKYTYVWKTDKTMVGCYTLYLSSVDTSARALFQLK